MAEPSRPTDAATMVNLMALYGNYLLVTFLLGCVQLFNFARVFRFILRSPARWPRLTRVIRQNLNTLLTWPTLLIVGLMSSLWGLHTALRRIIWPQATVTPSELVGHDLLIFLALLSGLLMLGLDLRALFRVSRFRPPRQQWLIDLTELGLKAEVLLPINWLVRWRVRNRMLAHMPLVHQWMWKRTAEISARLVFGTTLWAVYLLSP